MLIHSNEVNMISRMQSLIELNTGADLRHKATYLEGNASVRINLWFIPGAMRMLNQTVADKEVVIDKKIILSY